MQESRVINTPIWPRSATTAARPHGKPKICSQIEYRESDDNKDARTHFSVPAQSSPRKSVGRDSVPLALPRSSVRKQLQFDHSELVESFEELMTPTNHSQKRLRSNDSLVCGTKRTRGSQPEQMSMSLEMYHPISRNPTHFRCYFEDNVLLGSNLLDMMIESNMDDDCPTDDEQVEAAKDQLGRRLMRAINSFKP
mmetsp:Transcript_18380/g.33050  ORF Transcript_18380/g.33050 Transcript_18380/m.33050 type:complete len:195 (-) Transcript_18380:6-590(-)